MRRTRTIATGAAIFWISACSQGESVSDRAATDQVVMVGKDDAAMLAAFARARGSLDEFLAKAESPASGLSGFALKVGIREGDDVEYFWLTPFSRTGDAFVGTINNDPEIVSRVRLGQEYEFKRSDIFDWTYSDDQNHRMLGNFTACALLTHEPAEEAEAFKKEYGLDCGS